MLTLLMNASIAGSVVVAAVWIVTRLFRTLSPSARTAIWWCATAKFVVALVWVAPVMLPVLPAPAVRVAAESIPPVSLKADITPAVRPQADTPTRRGTAAATDVVIALWLLGVAVSAGVSVRRWRRMRDAIRRATACRASLQKTADEVAARLGMRRVPRVMESADVETPLVTGCVNPVVLVPARRFAALSAEEQRMALCHELMHLKRGDLWFGCLPAIAERLFFFHPLAHVAAREYVFWREAACDAAVVEALDAAPQDYGRLLLNLGVARRSGALAAAGAPWSFSNLKRRIVMLGNSSNRSRASRMLAASAIGIVVVSVVPVQLTARPAPPRPADASGQREVPVRVVPSEEVRASEVLVRPETAQRDFRYVIFVSENGDEHSTMSGSRGDMDRAKRVRRAGETLLWFTDGEREYVVRDPVAIAQARSLWKRVGELGAEQGKLGAEQGALGARQGQIGAEQGRLGAEQGVLGARQGTLGARQAVLHSERPNTVSAERRRAINAELDKIDEEMRALAEQMRALGEKMRELGKPMEDLGAEMRELGREMEKLGEEMRMESAKAEREMDALLQRLISGGGKVEIVK